MTLKESSCEFLSEGELTMVGGSKEGSKQRKGLRLQQRGDTWWSKVPAGRKGMGLCPRGGLAVEESSCFLQRRGKGKKLGNRDIGTFRRSQPGDLCSPSETAGGYVLILQVA